jgi:hypothetical protein
MVSVIVTEKVIGSSLEAAGEVIVPEGAVRSTRTGPAESAVGGAALVAASVTLSSFMVSETDASSAQDPTGIV